MKIRLNKALRVALLTAMLAHPAIYAEDTTFTGGDVSTDVTLTNTTTTVDYVILNSTDSQSSAQLTLDGSTLSVTSNAIAGLAQNGSLKLSGGSSLEIQGELRIATDEGSVGKVEASGEGTLLNVLDESFTIVGREGNGTLEVKNGATADLSFITVADREGGVGAVRVSGSGAELDVRNIAWVGYAEGATGSLAIEDSATVTIQKTLQVGQFAGSEGLVLVTGEGSSLSVEPDITYIGIQGTGSLVVSDGGQASLSYLNIGLNESGTGTVLVTGEKSLLSASQNSCVGYTGTGTLNVEKGASASFEDYLNVGEDAGSVGTIHVSGTNSHLSVVNSTWLGLSGEGTLEVSNGAQAEFSWLIAAGNKGGSATITVTDSGSSLSASQNAFIGYYGTGSMTVQNGASVSIQSYLTIGSDTDAQGSVLVTGADSSLSVLNNTTYVGSSGEGSLVVSNGAQADLSWVQVGSLTGGSGTILVTDAGSSLSATKNTFIGNYGTGSMTVQNGASVSLQNFLTIGNIADAQGSVLVTGTDSSLSVLNNTTYVGSSGEGALEIANGAQAKLSWVQVGGSTGGSGTILVTDAGSSLSATKNTFIGNYGTGSMTVQSGASVSVVGNTYIGNQGTGNGSVVITGTGSSLSTNGWVSVGEEGTGSLSILDGATVNIQNELDVAYDNDASGSVFISGDQSSLTATADSYVALYGTGTMTIENGASATFTNQLNVGYNDSGSGSISLTGINSSLSVDGLTCIGYEGSGDLTVQDGASAFLSNLRLAQKEGCSGSVLVSGTGSSLSVAGTTFVGIAGTGNLSIADGASVETLSKLQLADREGSEGSVVVTGSGSNLSVDIDAYIGMAGAGSMTISDGGSVAIVRSAILGKSSQEVQTGTGSIDVTGEDSRLFIGDSLALGYDDHLGAGTLTLSDGASVYVGNSIQVFGSVLSMDSSSTLTASKVIVAPGGTSSLTLGGTNSLGDIYISYEESDDSSALSLNLLASGTSVLQGGIAVCNQFQQTDHSYTAANAPSTPITSWADVSVSFDLTNDALDLIGNRIYLLKTADGHEFFDNGIVIEGVARDVSTDLVNFSKTVGDKTISFNYVYDGTSITFSDAMTVTFDQVDALDDDSISIEKTALLVSQDVVGDVDTESEPNEVVFTPTIDIQDHSEYVIAVGENAEETHFSIATTTYKQENIFTYSNAEGEVFKTEIELEDVGITDLTLYVDGTEATISGGVVGLNAEPVSTQSLLRAASIEEGTPSNLSNVLVENGGSLTLTDGNVLNADRRLIAEDGTIVLNSSTMNIGGGNLDEFRNNVYVENSDVDWDALVDSTIDHSSIQLSNGSALNFARVLDDAVTTEVVIENSSVNIGEDSSLNAGTGVDMVVRNSTILGAGKVSAFTSHNNTYTAGKNNVGVLELKNVASTNDTMGTSIVGENVISGVRNSDTANTMSQLKLSDGTTVSNGTFQLNVVGDSSLLTDGTSFQVLDLESALDGGFTNFTETGTLLMDGYVWDYSLLNSNGVVSVILAQLGDGARIANSMYSSAKAVSYAGQVAMDHLATSYTGNYGAMGNNFWISSLGTYQCVGSHSGRTGYTFQSAGYAVGFDHAFSEGVIEGMAIGQTWGKHYPKQGTAHYSAGKIDQDAMLVTLYGMESLMKTTDGQDEINLLHSISFGSVSNKSVKNALFNNKQATAKWDDDVWSIGVRGVWNHRIDDQWTLSPFVAVDYEHVSQDSFTERFNNSTAHYNGGNYQNLDVSLGASAGCTIKFDNNMELSPTASIAYVGSVLRNTPTVGVSTPTGKIVRDKAVNPGGNAIEATAGVLWKINDSTNVSANYSFYAAHDTTSHNANVMVSYSF